MNFELWEMGLCIAIFGGLAAHHLMAGKYFKTNLTRGFELVTREQSPSEFTFCVVAYSLVAFAGLGLLIAKLVQQ